MSDPELQAEEIEKQEQEGRPGHNGGGKLKSGNTVNGDKGGRPPNEVRQACRLSFEQRITVLEEIADSPDTPAAARINAVEALGRFGLGTKVDVTSDDAPVKLYENVNIARLRGEEEPAVAPVAE